MRRWGSLLLLGGFGGLMAWGVWRHVPLGPDRADQEEALLRALAPTGGLGVPFPSISSGESTAPPPGDPDPRLEEARRQMAADRCPEALIVYRAVHLDHPDKPLVKRMRVEALVECAGRALKKGRNEEAIRDYQEALELRPNQSDALLGAGQALVKEERLEEAADRLSRYLRYRDDDTNAHHLLGGVYYKLGRLEKAEAHLLQGTGHGPQARRLLDLTRRRLEVESGFWTTESAHFRIKYDAQPCRDLAGRVLGILEEAYRYVGDRLGTYPEEQPSVVLYSREAFGDITRSPDWTGAIYDGEIRVPVGGLEGPVALDKLARMLFHEYTHVVIHQLSGNRCPTWINEGLAQAVEYAFELPEIPLGGTPLPLEDLQITFLRIREPGVAVVAYRQSLDMVRQLIGDFGLKYIRDYLRELRAGEDPEAVFRLVFGLESERFFKTWLERRYP